jgi:hypothetical protein
MHELTACIKGAVSDNSTVAASSMTGVQSPPSVFAKNS